MKHRFIVLKGVYGDELEIFRLHGPGRYAITILAANADDDAYVVLTKEQLVELVKWIEDEINP